MWKNNRESALFQVHFLPRNHRVIQFVRDLVQRGHQAKHIQITHTPPQKLKTEETLLFLKHGQSTNQVFSEEMVGFALSG
jgi:hypothetical protein